MSVLQKDMKYLKEKQKSLKFFLDYVDISKLRLLQILNEEQEALNVLRVIRSTNAQFLEKINKNFFKGEITYEEKKEEVISKTAKILFLVDSKDNDEYTKFIYKKLEEQLASTVTRNDVIVTFGNNVNSIAQRLELRVIQHFAYDVYLDYNQFIEKITTLIEVGLKNRVFAEAHLIIAQQNQDSREIISKKLIPFQKIDNLNKDDLPESKMEHSGATGTYTREYLQTLMQNANEDYLDFFHDLDIRTINWYPNVHFFKFKFIKSIIKQNIVELRMIEKIQRIKMEIQLLDEKRNKLMDEASLVNRWLNRVRREKSTEATIVLYAAFKLKATQGNEWDELIRKKREEEDELNNSPKGRGK